MARTQRTRRSRAQWLTIIKEFRASGLASHAYCEQMGLPFTTFTKWQARLNTTSTDVARFVALNCESEPIGEEDKLGWDLDLSLGDGITLRLRRGR